MSTMKIGDYVWVDGKMTIVAGRQPDKVKAQRHYGQILAIKDKTVWVVLDTVYATEENGRRHFSVVQVSINQLKEKK